MRLKFFALFFAVFLQFSSNSFAAQDKLFLSKEEIVAAEKKQEKLQDVEKKQKSKNKILDFLSKSTSGSIGAAFIQGENNENREYSYANIRFDGKKNGFRVVFDGIAEKTKITLSQNKINSDFCIDDNCNNLPENRTISYSDSNFRIQDSFVSYDIGSFATISGGKKRIVWGQFEPFSPTNMAFPINISITNPSYSKLNGAIGQEFIGLEIYPSSNVKIENYIIPRYSFDRLTSSYLKRGNSYHEATPNGDNIEYSIQNFRNGQSEEVDDPGYASRIGFYPEWGTVAFSFAKGYDSIFKINKTTIRPLLNQDGSEYSFGADNFAFNEGDNYYTLNSRPTLSEQKMYGFELAIPVDKATFKFEVASFDKFYELSYGNSQVLSRALNGYDSAPGFSGNFTAAKNLANWAYKENNGKLYFPYKQILSAAGFDLKLDRWMINAAILYRYNYIESKYQKHLDFAKEAFPNLNEDNIPRVFPMLNVARYLGERKSALLGVGAGVIGNGTGVGVYFSKDFFEAFSIHLTAMKIKYFSDSQVEDLAASSQNYEKQNGYVNSYGAAIKYSF